MLKCGERAGRFVREEMGGAAGGGGNGARRREWGKHPGVGRHHQQHQQNGSSKEDGAPTSPLLRFSMKVAEENDNSNGNSDGISKVTSLSETSANNEAATKSDEREEGEVEEAKKPAADVKEDGDTIPLAKRQRLDGGVTKNSAANNTIADTSLLNICQPVSSSTSNEGGDSSNQQMRNPITATAAAAAAATTNGAVSKVKVADPEWLARHPPHLRRLVRAAADRNTTLLLMPAGMARRKENTTTHSPKQDVIRWRIEIRCHLQAALTAPSISGDSDGDSSKPGNLPCSVVTIFLDGIPESNKLSDVLSAQLDVNPEGKNREARSKLRTMAAMPRSSLRILTKLLPCPASRPVYAELRPDSSVADSLAGLTVVEHPVFEIVKEGDLDKFPRKIEELTGAD